MKFENQSMSTITKILKRFLIIILLVVSIIAVVAILIYGFYRIAVYSRSLYSIVFYIALSGLFIYYVCRSIRKKRFTKVLLKITKVLSKIVIILFIVAFIILYGAFFIRYPLIGFIVTPVLIFAVIVANSKLSLFSLFKKYFHDLT